ncbi:phosphoglycerate mutase-like protein [Pseudovirgaria hyperparasitica]|uniref:Phosphoglycerate mutase-like protein n=1 Tax=Pseudovirgaria hyperparasitica TaxID=470096 RepID=A0A6A6WJ21_9PEZI|nr:phosphoglycerate mutase-like protein [Pseudovirgaria hyperparasitica]KAF2761727.1 phosphoglycerate mutase-like protein [Pseudovirgaria hyperparasitica]
MPVAILTMSLSMSRLAVLASTALLVQTQDLDMRVHGTVVFTRAGERLPSLLGSGVRELTSLGAQQLHIAGDFFRNRYLTTTGGDGNDTIAVNHIVDIDYDIVNDEQVLVMAPEGQHTYASAQAFMQGLFPPYEPTFAVNSSTNATFAALPGGTESVLANGSYLNYPLNGYQYAQIRTYSSMEPHSIYLAGALGCDNHALSMFNYFNSTEFKDIQQRTRGLFSSIAGAAMGEDVLTSVQRDYGNAWNIYEYLNYRYNHDNGTQALFSAEDTSFTGDYERIRALASQQQWAFYGDSDVDNGIRAIPGRTLAAQVLGLLQQNIETRGVNYKLNLLFGDHEPFIGFSSLAAIAERNSQFYGLPEYGSSMVFELYSMGTANDTGFPAREDLWVAFYFRNGTSNEGYDLRSYPIFHRGPSTAEISWVDFESYMSGIMTSKPGDWCTACGSSSAVFCPFYDYHTTTQPPKPSSALSPAVAGVIGAIVTLVVLALIAVAAFAFGGIRMQRNSRRHSNAGGYKGSAKMASDADLIMPQPAVIAGATNGGREHTRMGSWELRQKEMRGTHEPERTDEDEDDLAVSPYGKPVQPQSSF